MIQFDEYIYNHSVCTGHSGDRFLLKTILLVLPLLTLVAVRDRAVIARQWTPLVLALPECFRALDAELASGRIP